MRTRDGRHLVAVLALLCGCGDVATAPSPAPAVEDSSPLQGGLGSLDAIGQAVVDGLNNRDEAALSALLLTEPDFKGRLFAVLANHPNAAQMGPDLLWDMQRRGGADELARALERFGGQDLRYVGLEPERVEVGPGVRFHRRPLLVVDERRGERRKLQVLGSIVEHLPSGSFKLITYRFRD
ncbi:MAG: hypothetical protein IPO88_06225 [Nannocystis sp.]|uniref:hypothetical protein n=1 Tax=Nannocystis sp. TaxID=1962667 RepID=UPI002426B441|nr:hypothetical protein [Nannocystis sp.]MBK9753094.1 hypothetical protein [Nannocystis sp.]